MFYFRYVPVCMQRGIGRDGNDQFRLREVNLESDPIAVAHFESVYGSSARLESGDGISFDSFCSKTDHSLT